MVIAFTLASTVKAGGNRRKNCSSGSVTFDSAIKGRMLFGRGYYSKFKNSIFYIFLGEANIACCGLTHL